MSDNLWFPILPAARHSVLQLVGQLDIINDYWIFTIKSFFMHGSLMLSCGSVCTQRWPSRFVVVLPGTASEFWHFENCQKTQEEPPAILLCCSLFIANIDRQTVLRRTRGGVKYMSTSHPLQNHAELLSLSDKDKLSFPKIYKPLQSSKLSRHTWNLN